VTPYRWNQFGASGGGPVVIPKLYNGKNKTFFFVAYEGYRLRQPANNYLRVPTAANLGGDLSDQPNPIYNPYSTVADPNHPGQFIRTPFANNQIPQSLIDPGFVKFAQSTLPAPNFSGIGTFNVLDTTPGAINQEEYSARVDQTISAKDSVWFRWSGTINSQTSSGGRPELGTSNDMTGKNIGANWVHIFSPSSVLDAQFGYMWVDQGAKTRYRSLPPDLAQQVGFSPNFTSGFHNVGTLFPNVSVANYFSGGENEQLNSPWTVVWQQKGNYSRIIGRHTLKVGADYNRTRFAGDVLNNNVGFTTFETANPQSPGNSGSALASFLLDVPNNASRRNTLESTSWGGVLGLYVQDQWKATSNLTVNVGLRYDRRWQPTYGRPEDGNQYVGDADLIRGIYILQKQPGTCAQLGKPPCNPTPGGGLPAHTVVADNGKVNHDSLLDFAPRLGLAYRLGPNTAIRSGFGIFYDEWAAYQQSSQNMQGTWPSVDQQFANNLNSPQSGSPTPTVSGKNPIPSSTFPSPDPFSTFTWYFDPYMKPGYSMQWNFGIQHQFGTNTLASVNYVGSGSSRQPLSSVYNTALTPGPGKPQSRSQYPYAGIDYFDRSWGRSNYHSLQAMIQKRTSAGLSYSASYTWSKTISVGCDGWYGFEGCSVEDPYHFNNDRSIAVSDVPHLFAASWLYELPIGTGKRFKTGNGVIDYIIGNWQTNGILSLQAGQPYNLYISSDIANVGVLGSDQGERPNLVGNPSVSNPTPTAWFNKAAYQAPAPFTFGNLGRNTARSVWGRNLDVSLFRQFPFKETRRIEFRADAFNVTNTPVFAAPHHDMNDPDFGKVTSTRNSERRLQLALKVVF
jgi:outer membrane receptor protein involved in Fe transport